jgi:hypothetical protein
LICGLNKLGNDDLFRHCALNVKSSWHWRSQARWYNILLVRGLRNLKLLVELEQRRLNLVHLRSLECWYLGRLIEYSCDCFAWSCKLWHLKRLLRHFRLKLKVRCLKLLYRLLVVELNLLVRLLIKHECVLSLIVEAKWSGWLIELVLSSLSKRKMFPTGVRRSTLHKRGKIILGLLNKCRLAERAV